MAGRAGIPAARMRIFPARALLQKELPGGVEHKDVDGAMQKPLRVNLVAARDTGRRIGFIHDIEHLPMHILRGRRCRRDAIRERNPLAERELLGARGFRDIQLAAQLRPIERGWHPRREELSHLLAALGEAELHQAIEKRAVAVGQLVSRAARQGDHAGIDFRRGRKNAAGERAQILDAPDAPENQGERAVILGARLCGEARGEFALKREDKAPDRKRLLGELQKELARRVVWEIPQDAHRAAAEESARVVAEGVAMNDLGPWKLRAQEPGEAAILFQQSGRSASREGELGERAEPGADLDEVIAGLEIELRDDPLREILVVEKILPQAFRRLDGELGESVSDRGKLHRQAFTTDHPSSACS